MTSLALVLLSACSRPCPPVTPPLLPPAFLMEETPEPELSGTKVKDLVDWSVALRAALRAANGDKKILRDWVDEVGKINVDRINDR